MMTYTCTVVSSVAITCSIVVVVVVRLHDYSHHIIQSQKYSSTQRMQIVTVSPHPLS